eukprot:XP_011682038.1 PREDICTED: proline-rich transmembrane protein 1-like [Strongylocentrotus purpuratus]
MFITEYKKFTNEGYGVEGASHNTLHSYDERKAIPSLAQPQSLYPPPNSSGYPLQQPSHSQQASQFPQQQPGTYAPQSQVVQVPTQQNIVHVSTGIAPDDYFGQALFVTLCCCLPFGIVALIKSIEVRKRSAEGDYHSAAVASSEAARWSTVGFMVGCVVTGVCVTVGCVLGIPSGIY